MDIFRDGEIPSPVRQAFGLHPTTNEVLVPIDLCLLNFNSSIPNFNLIDPNDPKTAIGNSVLESTTGILLGKIPNIFISSTIEPIIALDSSSPNGLVAINSVRGNVGDKVQLNAADSVIQGSISMPISNLSFPGNPGLNVRAYLVDLSFSVGPRFIGSPIVLAGSNQTIGMLLSRGSSVLVAPF
jgi:hypothetical protein